jgi:hypothetical protein
LYDSLSYDVILDDLQQQVEHLVWNDFREINSELNVVLNKFYFKTMANTIKIFLSQ